MLHVPTLQLIALKSIDVFERATRHQLIQELSAFSGSENPNVVNFLGAYFEDGATKLALEYLNRGSLQDVLDEYKVPFPEDVLASIAKQSLLGLQHLHTKHKVLLSSCDPSSLVFSYLLFCSRLFSPLMPPPLLSRFTATSSPPTSS
jgi:serine/threonine protein kinase